MNFTLFCVFRVVIQYNSARSCYWTDERCIIFLQKAGGKSVEKTGPFHNTESDYSEA